MLPRLEEDVQETVSAIIIDRLQGRRHRDRLFEAKPRGLRASPGFHPLSWPFVPEIGARALYTRSEANILACEAEIHT